MFLERVSNEVFWAHGITATRAFHVNAFVRQQMSIPGCRSFFLVFRFVRNGIYAALAPPMNFVMLCLPVLHPGPFKIHLTACGALIKTTFVFQTYMG